MREALAIEPANKSARALARCLERIQEQEGAYRQARASGRWSTARTAWKECVRLYREEGCAAPVKVRCWEVDLAIAEGDWEKAESTAE